MSNAPTRSTCEFSRVAPFGRAAQRKTCLTERKNRCLERMVNSTNKQITLVHITLQHVLHSSSAVGFFLSHWGSHLRGYPESLAMSCPHPCLPSHASCLDSNRVPFSVADLCRDGVLRHDFHDIAHRFLSCDPAHSNLPPHEQ